ncbi:hypothetical protein [Bacillus sp. FJAT-45350]|uniref:hypothetical protein n=1 Tax=Bacillus sp. FJAT-45350 TaxID=2011014 RepID=UPI0015CC3ABA|nr:hypothetical protein [Bacillus sp. FJAT-45350]
MGFILLVFTGLLLLYGCFFYVSKIDKKLDKLIEQNEYLIKLTIDREVRRGHEGNDDT